METEMRDEEKLDKTLSLRYDIERNLIGLSGADSLTILIQAFIPCAKCCLSHELSEKDKLEKLKLLIDEVLTMFIKDCD